MSLTSPKTLMVVAAGEWQVPLICKAKEAGFRVITTNPYPDSPGFVHSDVSLLADVLDRETNLEYAINHRPDGVITDQSDIAVPTVAYICQKLGLSGIGLDVADRFTNKFLMRQRAQELGLPSPAFRLCRSQSEAEDFMRKQPESDFVVKPPASQSSRGVSKVSYLADLDPAYSRALAFSRDGTVLIEQFIGGVELTVDGIKTHTNHYCLATSTKTHYPHNCMVANRLIFSNSHPDINFSTLHGMHNELVKALGLPFGLTHAEYKYVDGKFYLIEVAARGGGTRISSDIVPLMSGVDSNALLIRMALGERIETLRITDNKVVAALDFLNFEPGIVQKIHGYEAAISLPGVIEIGLNVQVGNDIQPPQDDRARHGYVIAYDSSLERLNELLQKIKNCIRIEYA